MDFVTHSQMRISIGGSGVAMSVSANCSRGKHLSEERFFSPPKRFAKAYIAFSEPPMLIRICENVAISTFTLLTVY